MNIGQRLLVVRPENGTRVDLAGLGVDFKVSSEGTDGRLSIVEHPMEPGRLVPPHVHHREDELSYVLEGTFGVRVGNDVATVGPGCYVYKPRGVPHTFWNPGPVPARLIEIIWPAGFERFFEQLAEVVQTGHPDLEEKRAELGAEYGLDFVPEWIPQLEAEYGLRLLGPG